MSVILEIVKACFITCSSEGGMHYTGLRRRNHEHQDSSPTSRLESQKNILTDAQVCVENMDPVHVWIISIYYIEMIILFILFIDIMYTTYKENDVCYYCTATTLNFI